MKLEILRTFFDYQMPEPVKGWIGQDDIIILSMFALVVGRLLLGSSTMIIIFSIMDSMGLASILFGAWLFGAALLSAGVYGIRRGLSKDHDLFKKMRNDSWARFLSFFLVLGLGFIVAAILSPFIGSMLGTALAAIITILIWIRLFGIPSALRRTYP